MGAIDTGVKQIGFFTVMNLPLALDQPFYGNLGFFYVRVVQMSTRLFASTLKVHI